MNYFWDEEVPYIYLFDVHHNLYIVLMGILLLILIKYYKQIQLNQVTVRKWILGILVVQQVSLYSWYFFEMGFDIGESLPLHISRISSILCLIYLITTKRKVMDVLFFFGLYAYGSFLYPSRVYPIYHLMGLSFFINHVVTILLPIIVVLTTKWRPSISGLFKSFGWFLLYFFFVYFLNPLIDGNYFYLKYRPFFGHLPDTQYVPLVLTATFVIFLIGYFGSKVIETAVHHQIS